MSIQMCIRVYINMHRYIYIYRYIGARVGPLLQRGCAISIQMCL